MKHISYLHRMSLDAASLVIFSVQFAPFEDWIVLPQAITANWANPYIYIIAPLFKNSASAMKICHHLWGTSQFFPLHEEAAAESRHLLFRSMKFPWERLLSQLCFKTCRSSLLSPWEQRRRSWTSSDKPSRAALSQGPDTWQPVGEAMEIQRIYFILSVSCTKRDLVTKSSRSLFLAHSMNRPLLKAPFGDFDH